MEAPLSSIDQTKRPFQDFVCDPLHTSDQESGADYLRSNNVKITFCGFHNKNEICLEGCIWHPIKAHLCQKSIFIDINYFYQTLLILHCKSLTLVTHK